MGCNDGIQGQSNAIHVCVVALCELYFQDLFDRVYHLIQLHCGRWRLENLLHR